jgi:16S rRNA (uracil1498-N3)-methyltransferase
MDLVIQKCTELGVAEVQPLYSSRCQGKLSSLVTEKKRSRWQRIALTACKQCRRCIPPKIGRGMDFRAGLSTGHREARRLLFYEDETECFPGDLDGLSEADHIMLAIGPEGGFSADEVDLARESGWQTVSLGALTLRAETATLTAVAVVQFLAGGMAKGANG